MENGAESKSGVKTESGALSENGPWDLTRPTEVLSHSERETETIGARLAEALRPGDVIALRGDLGMGKTAFVRGLAQGLGYAGRVTSPTFTLVNEYEGGRLPLFHFDLYRLRDAGDLFQVGWDDYLDRNGVCAAEWSERVQDALPPETITVELRRGEEDFIRRITVTPGRFMKP